MAQRARPHYTNRAGLSDWLFGSLGRGQTCKIDFSFGLDRVEDVTRFTRMTLRAQLTVPPGTDADKAWRLLEKAEKACLITNSLALTPELSCEIETS